MPHITRKPLKLFAASITAASLAAASLAPTAGATGFIPTITTVSTTSAPVTLPTSGSLPLSCVQMTLAQAQQAGCVEDPVSPPTIIPIVPTHAAHCGVLDMIDQSCLPGVSLEGSLGRSYGPGGTNMGTMLRGMVEFSGE